MINGIVLEVGLTHISVEDIYDIVLELYDYRIIKTHLSPDHLTLFIGSVGRHYLDRVARDISQQHEADERYTE